MVLQSHGIFLIPCRLVLLVQAYGEFEKCDWMTGKLTPSCGPAAAGLSCRRLPEEVNPQHTGGRRKTAPPWMQPFLSDSIFFIPYHQCSYTVTAPICMWVLLLRTQVFNINAPECHCVVAALPHWPMSLLRSQPLH